MADWIYFAAEQKAPLAATLETVLNTQFLWRSARNAHGALIANVMRIAEGDHIVVAWRHSGGVRTAYLRCRVAAPLSPMEPGLVIDRLGEPDASVLTSAGYPKNSDGEVEGIRLNDIVECCFQLQGEYGGQNAIHRLAAQELALLSGAASLPQEAFRKRVDIPDLHHRPGDFYCCCGSNHARCGSS